MRSAVGRYILEATVFVCGALVMIYEIVGSRIVSPFIGTSTYVWTSLIGVILASLSLGYWLGGRLADRRPDPKVLASVIFVAGGLVSLTIFIKDVVLTAVASAPFGLGLKAVFASLFLFGPASVALGVVTPYAVKLRMLSLADSGATVGSIAGTFAAGFFLIPFVGSVRTLYIIAASLMLTAIVLTPFAFTRARVAVLVLLATGIVGSEASAWFMWKTNELHDVDSEYSRIRVFRMNDPKTGRDMRALATDPYYSQSAVYLDGDDLAFRYTPFYHLLRHYRPGGMNTLMIGGAGYTYPRDYLRTYSDATIDVVEIDSKMTDLARRFFRLQDDPRLKIIHEDGRVFLNSAETAKYDVVLMDAFGSLFSVPYHLTTIEAVRNISRVLDDDGIVIFNVGSAIRGPESKFLQAEYATYEAVFPRVLLFKVNLEMSDDATQNVMIVACKSDCGTSEAPADAEIARLLSHLYAHDFPRDTPILTDDLAPVEYYNSFSQNAR